MTSPTDATAPHSLKAPHSSIDWSAEPDLEGLRRARSLWQTDKASAIDELSLLADRGSLVAMNFIGGCYSVGDGLPKNIGEAEKLFRRASEAGSVDGTYRLGLLYRREGEFEKALKAFNACAAIGYVPGLDKLGSMYLNGEGVEADRDKAKELWERAAAKGHIWAKRHLAGLFLSGAYGVTEMPRGLRLLLSAIVETLRTADPERPTDLLR